MIFFIYVNVWRLIHTGKILTLTIREEITPYNHMTVCKQNVLTAKALAKSRVPSVVPVGVSSIWYTLVRVGGLDKRKGWRQEGRRREGEDREADQTGQKGKMVQFVLSPPFYVQGNTWQDTWSWTRAGCLGFYGLSCVCTHPWMDLFSPRSTESTNTLSHWLDRLTWVCLEHLWVSDEASPLLIKTINHHNPAFTKCCAPLKTFKP